jgi:N-acetylglutamate synthase-like GNAT family acetyltransferase
MEWGVREMLVEDPDGHGIRFGQNAPVSDREKSAAELPASVKIIARIATPKETQQLSASVGWTASLDPKLSSVPPVEIMHAAVAEDVHSKKVIGCVFLYGDSTGFFYVRNLVVDPDWQSKRVGTALMQEVTQWLEKNAPHNSTIWLHTPENLAPFYRQFGFMPVFGMMRAIRRHEE